MAQEQAFGATHTLEDHQFLPIAHIAELQFCERNFYYRVVEAAEDTNEHLLKGRWDDEKRMQRMDQRRDSGMQTRNVVVVSPRLGLIGAVDVLEETTAGAVIVEFKKGALRDHPNDDIQLCAQAMALEEMTEESLDYGFIYYHESHRRRKVWFTEDLREAVVDTVSRARDILSTGEIPAPVNDARCDGCSLQSRCLPGEVAFLGQADETAQTHQTTQIDETAQTHQTANLTKAARPTPSLHDGRILYIQDPGLYVKKDGRSLRVTRHSETIREIPIQSVDEVVSGSAVQWTSAALQFLFSEGIPLRFISQNGRLMGGVQPTVSKNNLLRLAQFEFRESPRRLELGRAFITGKLGNMRVMMLRHDRKLEQPASSEAKIALALLSDAHRKLTSASTRDEILGYEGIGSRAYFDRYRHWIKEPFEFSGRVRRPPTDPVNAMLSLGYSTLTNAVISAIHIVGMDPYVGFLHESVYGRPALALDLMEEFRSIVVDSVVLRIVNQGILSPADFEQNGAAVQLTDAARKSYYHIFENRMQEELTHPLFGYRLTYRRLIELQTRFVAKVLTGEIEHYIPLKVR